MKSRRFFFSFFLTLFALTSPKAGAIDNSKAPPLTQFYQGTIGDKLEVGASLTFKGTDIYGSYFYKGRTGEVTLKGSTLTDGSIALSESYKGNPSGVWSGRFSMSSRYDKTLQGELKDPDTTSFTGVWKGPAKAGSPPPSELRIFLERIDVKACPTCAFYPNTAAGYEELRGGEKLGPVVTLGNFKYQTLSKRAGKASRDYPVFISAPTYSNLKKLNKRIIDPYGVGKEEPLDPQCPSSEETTVSLSAPEVLRINLSYSSDCGAHPFSGKRIILFDLRTGTDITFKNIFKKGAEDLVPLLKTRKPLDGDPECVSAYNIITYASINNITPENVEISLRFPQVSANCDREVLIPIKDALKYASKTSILQRFNISGGQE